MFVDRLSRAKFANPPVLKVSLWTKQYENTLSEGYSDGEQCFLSIITLY